jgi:Flp pilus assembly pilin Flp
MGEGIEALSIPFAIRSIGKYSESVDATLCRRMRNSMKGLCVSTGGRAMTEILKLVGEEKGQDIAEYAVMLAVILVIVVGTIRLIGSNANNVFSSVASSVQ